MKNIVYAGLIGLALIGCGERDAKVALHNLSYTADNFELDRMLVI